MKVKTRFNLYCVASFLFLMTVIYGFLSEQYLYWLFPLEIATHIIEDGGVFSLTLICIFVAFVLCGLFLVSCLPIAMVFSKMNKDDV